MESGTARGAGEVQQRGHKPEVEKTSAPFPRKATATKTKNSWPRKNRGNPVRCFLWTLFQKRTVYIICETHGGGDLRNWPRCQRETHRATPIVRGVQSSIRRFGGSSSLGDRGKKKDMKNLEEGEERKRSCNASRTWSNRTEAATTASRHQGKAHQRRLQIRKKKAHCTGIGESSGWRCVLGRKSGVTTVKYHSAGQGRVGRLWKSGGELVRVEEKILSAFSVSRDRDERMRRREPRTAMIKMGEDRSQGKGKRMNIPERRSTENPYSSLLKAVVQPQGNRSRGGKKRCSLKT